MDWLAFIAALAAGLAGLLYLTRQVWRFFVAAQQIYDLVQHELNPNSGGSMKDDLAAVAVAMGTVQLQVAELGKAKDHAHTRLQNQLDSLAALVESHHPTHRKDPA